MQTQSNQPVKKLSARELWGKLTIYLREHNNIILHIICGDITDVEFDGEIFVINTNEYTSNILKEQKNQELLNDAFKFFGVEKFEVRKKQKQLTDDDNIKILNKYFDDIVKIIDKK